MGLVRSRRLASGDLASAIDRVVADGNCAGCGLCALLSGDVKMQLNSQGFLRPALRPSADRSPLSDAEFVAACPGVQVSSPKRNPGADSNAILGRALGAWQAWACDEEIRFAGSSGGVLTALASWMVESDQDGPVIGAQSDLDQPTRTASVAIESRGQALRSAGSRYAPVATLAFPGAAKSRALIVKPCEASALRALTDRRAEDAPLLLSFFCAGTPSQTSTDGLLRMLGLRTEDVTTLRYRGNGWPGRFTASDGVTHVSESYEAAWGKWLGRDLQDRCKICVDGTGEHADISVGDYWKSDPYGYPEFSEAPGVSAVIARTPRGLEVIRRAVQEGVIGATPISLNSIARVQPLQKQRRRTLLARVAGRLARGRRVPRYIGYPLWRGLVADPARSATAFLGSIRRSGGRPT